MKTIIPIALIALMFLSCEPPKEKVLTDPNVWIQRVVKHSADTLLETGSTFLSIYSQIYTRNDQGLYDLTSTVSMHNPNERDSVFVDRAVYYNTEGKEIRSYFDHPIYIRPMETVQLVIGVLDNEGGTGANFIFDWRKEHRLNDPLFEAIMVSSTGTHGISFVTEGKRLK